MYSYGTIFAEKHAMSRQPKHKNENSTQFPVKLLVLVESWKQDLNLRSSKDESQAVLYPDPAVKDRNSCKVWGKERSNPSERLSKICIIVADKPVSFEDQRKIATFLSFDGYWD